MLICFCVSLNRLVVNFLKGNFSPSWSNLFFLGDRFHWSAHSFLILVLNVCLMAEALFGSGCLSSWGRVCVALDLPSAACLARQSALLLPRTLLWLDIQRIVRFLVVLLAADRRICSRYWPGDVLGVLSAWITAWLSMYSDIFFPMVAGILSRIHSTRMAPIILASYVLWSDGEPR